MLRAVPETRTTQSTCHLLLLVSHWEGHRTLVSRALFALTGWYGSSLPTDTSPPTIELRILHLPPWSKPASLTMRSMLSTMPRSRGSDRCSSALAPRLSWSSYIACRNMVWDLHFHSTRLRTFGLITRQWFQLLKTLYDLCPLSIRKIKLRPILHVL